MSECKRQSKQEIGVEKDRLMGELIGLSDAVLRAIQEGQADPEERTGLIVLKTLVMLLPEETPVTSVRLRRQIRLVKAEKEKYAADGEPENAPDFVCLKQEKPQIQSLRGEILANVKKAAACAWSAWKNGICCETVWLNLCESVKTAAFISDPDGLKHERKQSEHLLTVCRRLEQRGLKKKQDERFMREAVRQARKAMTIGEVPIGCVVVRDGQVISRGYNRRTTDRDALGHAELTAIRRACKKLGDWRLSGCTLYVTLEPCPMCAGAMVQSRIETCVIGCMSDKSGCAGSVINLLQEKGFNHRVEIVSGVLEKECSEMLSDFFRQMRKKED